VGLYTGMDIPWTHIPPFSTTYKAGMGAQTPPPLMPQAPFPSYYAGAAAPPPQPPFYPASPMRPFYPEERGINPWNSRVAPYPYYMRQQGGFSFNRAEDDEVKLVVSGFVKINTRGGDHDDIKPERRRSFLHFCKGCSEE